MLRVFLDTTVVRNSQQKRVVWDEEPQLINWGGREFEVPVFTPHELTPNEKFKNQGNLKAYRDAKRIQYIEKIARLKLIKLLWHFELHWEFISRRKMSKGTPSICQYIEAANSPLLYGRTVASAFSNEDHQFEFLKKLTHPRYDEWKAAANVISGSKREKNQLLDAFHLWTAEHNWCDYFVTMDYKLIETVAQSSIKSSLVLVCPTEFILGVIPVLPAAVCERMGKWLSRRIIG